MNPIAQKYGAPALAGINLIPAEIAARKKMRAVQTLAVIIVLGAVALVVLGFLGALAAKQVAQSSLDNTLKDQEAAVDARDGKVGVYNDVRLREQQEYTLAQVAFGEMDYSQLTAAIQETVANDESSLDEIHIVGPNAQGFGVIASDDLYTGGVGGFSFIARATSYDAANRLLGRIEALPGVALARGVTESYQTDGEDAYWAVEGSAQITDLRLLRRLVPENGISGVDALAVAVGQDPDTFVSIAGPSTSPSPEPSSTEGEG